MTAATAQEDSSNPSTPNVSESKVQSVDAFPFGTDKSVLSKYRAIKTIYHVRHAEGTHNVNNEYRDIANLDARLTKKGEDQCRALARRIQTGDDDVLKQLKESVELVITSPVTRCMQTALLALEPVFIERPDVPVLAHEGIRETVNYNCDRRRTIQELQKDFAPQVDFSAVKDDNDALWDHYESWLGSDEAFTTYRESAQIYKVAERGRAFLLDFLARRPEEHIVLCSHRAFSRAFFNFGYGDCTRGLVQSLDDRSEKDNVPVLRYMGDDDGEGAFGTSMRAAYDNCELRPFILAFR
eukprot:CAMPEP_0198138106 /NCGR_PEP_ID=MMETSP1443-20131203/1529_1 /TAXON_ID=186043 /ORGANISM="Entomoneis sp., Strain CCMP2396" /LENGTH=296 /DNA_ID=CAMNT_0043799749 /DNA_START=125 /DNA_END=1015 /DNA_ORIENTATION=-